MAESITRADRAAAVAIINQKDSPLLAPWVESGSRRALYGICEPEYASELTRVATCCADHREASVAAERYRLALHDAREMSRVLGYTCEAERALQEAANTEGAR